MLEKTHEQILSEIWAKMRDAYTKRNEKIYRINQSNSPEKSKKDTIKNIKRTFEEEMKGFRARPWYQEALKSARYEWSMKHKFNKAMKDYESAQIAYRWKAEENIRNIPPELKDFRKKWEEEINISDESKEKIIKAVERIKPSIRKRVDWSMQIEMSLWWKKCKILDINIDAHSDDEYKNEEPYKWITKKTVNLWWMRGNNIKKWKNKKLAKYVEEQSGKWFQMPSENLYKQILKKLWEEAGLSKESDQIAMLMYLTGMYWCYRWTMNNKDSRSSLICLTDYRWLTYYNINYSYSSLCMISWK